MKFRFFITVFGLIVLLAVGSNCMADEKQTTANPEQSSQTPAPSSDNSDSKPVVPIEIFVEQLKLKMYEAAEAELSLCKDDPTCLYYAKQIKSWRCAASVCDGEEKGKEPVLCFEGSSDKYSKEVLPKINESMCTVIKSSTKETRQALSSQASDIFENRLVENGAYLLAFKGEANSCQDFIKSYVGAYGPNWNFKWYRAMSGCRILAHESTREKEEKDFSTWFGAEQGLNDCSGIVNSELKAACNTKGAASPKPSYETLPGATIIDTSLSQWVELLQLKTYKAAVDDLVVCKDDEMCLRDVKRIKYWVCAADVCDGKELNKEPLTCFNELFNNVSQDVRKQANSMICPLIESPSSEKRQALSKVIPDVVEDGLVQYGAYLMAIKGAAKSCQDYIKNYVGAYGPQWKPNWYAALSGCRILARESTQEQEEKDFFTWFGAEQELNNCSSIVNGELRDACNTPGAASPKFVYEK